MKLAPISLLLLLALKSSNAGFLNSPFSYFFNPGAPITSAASPYIHGFGSPAVFSPLVNFYHPQPILKTFYQPLVYHQPPQFLNLPTPQFYSLPQTSPPETAPASTGGYSTGPAKEEPKAGYGPPAKGGYSGPSGSSGSAPIEVFQDDFMGDKQSVVVDSDKARNPSTRFNNGFQPQQNDGFQRQRSNIAFEKESSNDGYQRQRSNIAFQPEASNDGFRSSTSNDGFQPQANFGFSSQESDDSFTQRKRSNQNQGFQSFIVNSRDRAPRQDSNSNYVYRDNSIRAAQDRPRGAQTQRPTGGY